MAGRTLGQSLGQPRRRRVDHCRAASATRARRRRRQALHARIARRLLELAEGSDLRAISEVMDRLDGAPARAVVDIEPQRIELRPITFERRD
ncbi:MAG: hypothetical protein FJ285_07625 [Planctomycetes bacterium]|nr:hypothetical protein [Planctomycetota bacterium]